MPPSAAAGQIRTRLSVLFASVAPKAVILRRGPRKHWRLIVWDLETDTFTPGQWMKGYIRLWDLSPSGRKLIYWAAQHHISAHWGRRALRRSTPYDPLTAAPSKRLRPGRRIPRYMRDRYGTHRQAPARVTGTWTGVSTPPYFSALAIWPAFGHWTGGGLFQTERSILVIEPEARMTPIENVPIPKSVNVRSLFGSEHGLQGSAQRASEGEALRNGPFWEALTGAGAAWVDWVHADPLGDLLFACDGCVYRLPKWQHAMPSNYLSAAKRIADFRDMNFELLAPPPDALTW